MTPQEKQLWDKACEAQRKLDIQLSYWDASLHNAPLAPYPIEEEEPKETKRSFGI